MLPPTPKPDVAHFVEDVNTSMSPVTLEPPPPLPLTVIYPWRPPNAQYSEWTPAPPTPISYATPVPNKVDHLKVGLLLSDVSMILCEMSREHRGNRLYDHYLRLPRVVAKKRREWDGLHWG